MYSLKLFIDTCKRELWTRCAILSRNLHASILERWEFIINIKGVCLACFNIIIGNAPFNFFISAIPWFCVEGLLKTLDFGYFVLIWWQTDKKQENFEAELQQPDCQWSINNTHYCAQLANAKNNNNNKRRIYRLKFWIWDSYLDIYLLMT